MSIWDALRQTQDASVLSNKGFLPLQSCHHRVGVRRVNGMGGLSECLSRDQSEEVTVEETENNAVALPNPKS